MAQEYASHEDFLRDWFLGRLTPNFDFGTNSRRRPRVSPPRASKNTQELGTEYARKYQAEEYTTCLKVSEAAEKFQRCRLQGPTMSLLEEDTSTIYSELIHPIEGEILKSKLAVFSEFNFSEPQESRLPIKDIREDLLLQLKTNNAIVIKGFTGCGKTTQVPQFILDQCAEERIPCNIVVTQPRRIAAISIAKRVCQERGWQLGTVVGYKVGMERRTSEFTCLTYMTTGCLLESLVAKKSLDGFTHIIVDEVHERDEDTDLLMLVVRKLLRHTRCATKVILMSATIDTTKLADYFSSPVNNMFRPAPVLQVESEQMFAVRVYYLDEINKINFMSRFAPNFDPTEPSISDESYKAAVVLISSLDEKRENVRFGLLHDDSHLSSCRGAVLVFLPGVNEIETMRKNLELTEEAAEKKNCWEILVLHSRVTSEEQGRVFKPPKHGYRKIILATNVAESSITVPDIIYVVDFCLTKQLVADSETNFCSLKVEWAPRNNCVQRKGRVGRVNDGVVFRMVPRYFYENHLPEDVKPEILRCPLEHTVLRIKLLDLGEPKALLALAMDPPELSNICRTIATLKEVGALFLTTNGKLTPFDGDLSYLGRVIARLPIDIHLGKLIMLGYLFNILEECIIMAAGLGSKNIFSFPHSEQLRAYLMKMNWAEGSFSDPITLLNAYQVWKGHAHSDYFRRSGQSEQEREYQWARKNFVQLKALKEMDCLVVEIQQRLKAIGIEPPSGPNIRPLTPMQKALLLRVVVFGAFYPHYFYRDAVSGQIDEREAVKSLCGKDPFTTVRLGGFPMNQPGKAYTRQIKENMTEIFKMLQEDTWNAKIVFDSSRVLIQFHQEGNPLQIKKIPGRIALPVYLALKQKQLQNRKLDPRANFYRVKLMDPADAAKYVQEVEEGAKRLLRQTDTESVVSGSSRSENQIPFIVQIPPARLPEVTEEILRVSVTHVEEPNRFWITRLDKSTLRTHEVVSRVVGEDGCNLKRKFEYSVKKGCLVMGPFGEGANRDYYRAKVLSVQQGVSDAVRRVKLYFIDFGNPTEVLLADLRPIPDELLAYPPVAFECRLTGVGPSLIHDPKGKWVKEAVDWFRTETLDLSLVAKVFSVVNGIVSIDLVRDPESEIVDWETSVAKRLVQLKYAIAVEEPYCSKMDNTDRQMARSVAVSQVALYRKKEMDNQRTTAAELVAMEHEVPEHNRRYNHVITLSGPTNPLEMRMYGKVSSLSGCAVHIEGDSVNSVLLDDQPGDCHERVLVAASIGIHAVENRVTVRNTTLLPAIHGLPALLTLLFAPRAELRADANYTRLTGALCGLGFDNERNIPLYQEHDMEINFDTDITINDVVLINKIRFYMNSILGYQSSTDSQVAASTERMRHVVSKMLQLLFDLLPGERKDVEVVHYPRPLKWNMVPSAQLLPADNVENQLGNLIPLHSCIKVVP